MRTSRTVPSFLRNHRSLPCEATALVTLRFNASVVLMLSFLISYRAYLCGSIVVVYDGRSSSLGRTIEGSCFLRSVDVPCVSAHPNSKNRCASFALPVGLNFSHVSNSGIMLVFSTQHSTESVLIYEVAYVRYWLPATGLGIGISL